MSDGPEELLPERSSDDRDEGWGDRPAGGDHADAHDDPDDLRRFLENRPPHHGD